MSLIEFISEKFDRITHRDADDQPRARGIWGRMSDDERQRALSYDGEESFGETPPNR